MTKTHKGVNTMPSDLVKILEQIPAVVAIIWIVLELDKRNRAGIEKTNQQYQESINKIIDQNKSTMERLISGIDIMTKSMQEHDERMNLAITRMDERTKDNDPPTRPRRTP